MTDNQFRVDFIGVGAPKSGSSWLAKIIQEHPDAQMSYTKEVTFFNDTGGIYHNKNTNYRKGVEWYQTQFPKKNSKIIGEFSTDYLYDKKAAQRLKKHFPNTKILVTLRDPVAKMYSYYWWYKNTDKTENARTFEIALQDNNEYINRSKYYPQLKRFYDNFKEEQIKVVLHNDIIKNPRHIVREVYEFLGIDRTYAPSLLDRKVNPSRKTRSKTLTVLLDIAKYMRESKFNVVVNIFKELGIYQNLHRAYIKINMKKFDYPPMKKETRRMLISKLKADIQKTEKLIGRDLSHWLQV